MHIAPDKVAVVYFEYQGALLSVYGLVFVLQTLEYISLLLLLSTRFVTPTSILVIIKYPTLHSLVVRRLAKTQLPVQW